MTIAAPVRRADPQCWIALFLLAMIALSPMRRADAGEPVGVELSRNKTAAFPVVVARGASANTKKTAEELAAYLGRITGATFKIVPGDGATGIAVGVRGDFPGLGLDASLDGADPSRREDYLLRSHARGVYLIGATEQAVPHAVWDLLYRLGHRQFFPGPNWEVVPAIDAPRVAVDVLARPDYLGRRIWYGFGTWPDCAPAKQAWDRRNRMGDGLSIRSGHAYDAIYRANKEEFDKHPEYLCSTKPVKFVISNPGLQKLVVDYALKYFAENPDADSISMEPSDGGGWDCPADEKAFASVTDRVVTLANEVAAAVNEKYPGKWVGIYAYYMHSPPPTIRVHPRVAVGVATAYIQGGFTFEQLMAGWARQGATLGVRDYYSVVISHKDRPGGTRTSDARRTAQNIRDNFARGARFLSAESSESWGPIGLPYYLASRLLWDTQADIDALISDFFARSFGPAEPAMRKFYALLDYSNHPLFSRDLIGRMYRCLDEARKLAGKDPGVRGRLDDLTLYTRYCELLWELNTEGKDQKLESTEAALAFAYRIRHTSMVASLPLWRDTRGGFSKPTGVTAWDVPEGKNPLKNSDEFMSSEVDAFVREGVERNPIAAFEPVSFDNDLVPAGKALGLKSGEMGQYGYTRANHTFYAWLDTPGTLELEVVSGQIGEKKGGAERTTTKGPDISIHLYAEEDAGEAPVATGKVPVDLKPHKIALASTFKGLHRIEIRDGGRGASLRWEPGTKVTIPSSGDAPTLLRTKWDMYFYVPRGTKIVGGFCDGTGDLLDGDGKTVYTFKFGEDRGYFGVPVPAGQDGRLWKFSGSNGRRLLMTVPPCLARSAEELLLPRAVVERDRRAGAD